MQISPCSSGQGRATWHTLRGQFIQQLKYCLKLLPLPGDGRGGCCCCSGPRLFFKGSPHRQMENLLGKAFLFFFFFPYLFFLGCNSRSCLILYLPQSQQVPQGDQSSQGPWGHLLQEDFPSYPTGSSNACFCSPWFPGFLVAVCFMCGAPLCGLMSVCTGNLLSVYLGG